MLFNMTETKKKPNFYANCTLYFPTVFFDASTLQPATQNVSLLCNADLDGYIMIMFPQSPLNQWSISVWIVLGQIACQLPRLITSISVSKERK